MFTQIILSALLLASLANAHFTIEYPEMRGDSFATGASQWIYPCKSHLYPFQCCTIDFDFLRCECKPDLGYESHPVAFDWRISLARPPSSMDLSLCQSGFRNRLSYIQYHFNSTTSERDREWHTLSAACSSTSELHTIGWIER
jgi:hypothetical protein